MFIQIETALPTGKAITRPRTSCLNADWVLQLAKIVYSAPQGVHLCDYRSLREMVTIKLTNSATKRMVSVMKIKVSFLDC